MIAWFIAMGWVSVVAAVVQTGCRRIAAWRAPRAVLGEPRWSRRWARRVAVLIPGSNVMSVFRRRIEQRRQHRVTIAELPAAVDLIAVGVGAGASLLHSMQLVADWAHPNVRAEFVPVLRRVEMGALLSDSLVYPSPSPSPAEVRTVFDALATSVRLGTAVQPTLARLAADARAREMRAAAAHARTIPVRLIFPLVLLVLPAFVLLTVVPSLVAGWRSL